MKKKTCDCKITSNEERLERRHNKQNLWMAVIYLCGAVVLSGAMYANNRYLLGFVVGIVACFMMFFTHARAIKNDEE
jgi:hypothetical protein